ncbi:MAG: AmmeMemoRadiSam system protein B [Deltaproteobacteria bacterium]|nr:AmmeMemoRadiSam system protein B [Deltaproteobacteria bacterium]
MVRKPCVAGRFYPQEAAALRENVSQLLANGGTKEKAVAVMAPHAGYVYSGAVAGAVYATVSVPDAVILIGPNHTGLGENAAVMPDGVWRTPLGGAPVNEELAGLCLDSSPLFKGDCSAHLMEHSLEVQLPFIQLLNGSASIVPITVMTADAGDCEEMGAAIASAITAYGKDALIVISSDMNHYEPDKVTRAKDKLAIARVLALDAAGLLLVAGKKDITMCGIIPAAIAIFASKRLGAREAHLVRYATSGEAFGDFSQVVGYAGVMIK